MDYYQNRLDAAIAEGEPQVVELAGRSFLALGKIDDSASTYVGYEVEPMSKGTPVLAPLDYHIRLLDITAQKVHPLRGSLEKPHRLVSSAVIPLFDMVLEMIAAGWRRGQSQSSQDLLGIAYLAAESVLASGLWTDATLMMELWDQSINQLGGRRVSDFGSRPFNRTDLDALTRLMAEMVTIRSKPTNSG